MTEKETRIIDEIKKVKEIISSRKARITKGIESRENKNHDDYMELMFDKLSREEREIIYQRCFIEYQKGMIAALDNIEFTIENIFSRNGIKGGSEQHDRNKTC